jgi:transposase InsO family protein
VVSQRHELVSLAAKGGISFRELCRRFGISPRVGYKWRARFAAEGLAGLLDRPRGRGASRKPNQTSPQLERAVVRLRRKHPTWGPRKLRRRLQDLAQAAPPATTISRILRREGLIGPEASEAARPWQRFERERPNELWQMDFKGHFALARGGRCHPLTVLDDCSRYLLGLRACGDEQGETVRGRLVRLFRLNGLPDAMLCDNGPPWAASSEATRHTALSVWLMRLGVRILHGRPWHPQTQGKDERFHRTLQADLLARHDWPDLPSSQRRFDRFRHIYNHERPHEALGLATPASRYQPSPRAFAGTLPPVEYDDLAAQGGAIRQIKSKGELTFRNRFYYVGSAFKGLCVALRPTTRDGIMSVHFAAFELGLIDLRSNPSLPKGHYHPILKNSSAEVLPFTRNTRYP